MLFVTVFVMLCSLPVNRSIKLVIDGTFDLGPSLNFEYKLKTIPSFETKNKILSNTKVQRIQKSDDGKATDEENQRDDDVMKENNADVIHGAQKDGYVARTVLDGNEDDSEVDAEAKFKVTKLYKTVTSRNREMIGRAKKIEDDSNLMDFFEKIRNHSLQIIDGIRDEIKREPILSQFNQLEKTYVEKFGAYLNETKKHYIKTSLGTKKLIMNTIDYSDKIWNRLLNRFKSDAENSGLRSDDAVKILKESIETLKNNGYADACTTFHICRAGKAFSDLIQELLTILMRGDDTKIKSAFNALGKELKNADFTKIMDSKTQRVFKDRLTYLEELSPFELRVIIMAYIIIIQNRHQPFYNQSPNETWIQPSVALYNVMEKFDENFQSGDNKSWSDNIKKNLEIWIHGGDNDVTSIAKDLVNHVERKVIANFDGETAADLKEKLKLFILSEKLRLNVINFSYVPFQPFV